MAFIYSGDTRNGQVMARIDISDVPLTPQEEREWERLEKNQIQQDWEFLTNPLPRRWGEFKWGDGLDDLSWRNRSER
jgi:hypothetical protein